MWFKHRQCFKCTGVFYGALDAAEAADAGSLGATICAAASCGLLCVCGASLPNNTNRPNTTNTAALMRCTQVSGTKRVMRSPNHTTGAFANIMPKVVPATTHNPVSYTHLTLPTNREV